MGERGQAGTAVGGRGPGAGGALRRVAYQSASALVMSIMTLSAGRHRRRLVPRASWSSYSSRMQRREQRRKGGRGRRGPRCAGGIWTGEGSLTSPDRRGPPHFKNYSGNATHKTRQVVLRHASISGAKAGLGCLRTQGPRGANHPARVPGVPSWAQRNESATGPTKGGTLCRRTYIPKTMAMDAMDDVQLSPALGRA